MIEKDEKIFAMINLTNTTAVDHCTKCGAPIVVPHVWHGVVPPIPQYTCGCFTNFGAQWVTLPNIPNNGGFDNRNFGPGLPGFPRRQVRDDLLPPADEKTVKQFEEFVDKINKGRTEAVKEAVSPDTELKALRVAVEQLTKTVADLTEQMKLPKYTFTSCQCCKPALAPLPQYIPFDPMPYRYQNPEITCASTTGNNKNENCNNTDNQVLLKD